MPLLCPGRQAAKCFPLHSWQHKIWRSLECWPRHEQCCRLMCRPWSGLKRSTKSRQTRRRKRPRWDGGVLPWRCCAMARDKHQATCRRVLLHKIRQRLMRWRGVKRYCTLARWALRVGAQLPGRHSVANSLPPRGRPVDALRCCAHVWRRSSASHAAQAAGPQEMRSCRPGPCRLRMPLLMQRCWRATLASDCKR